MKNIGLGIIMFIVGLLGLLMTVCGFFFLPSAGLLALIGLVPGIGFILLARQIWQKIQAPSESDPTVSDSGDRPS